MLTAIYARRSVEQSGVADKVAPVTSRDGGAHERVTVRRG